ncbi:hypothetical protein Mmc1_2554 [Magnetococcus marinus MC-1]|uniref:Uncharacterized protein n=1 Tax=Magnetococcus marinus (strain ATCC BAA-1437 / JCM 17883 / MC-1) TaxID=156889 RepID=A0LAR0_MAGMM|nr:hypothetical protein Mmc1_2554 [Magnetococcus marinus MC-1]
MQRLIVSQKSVTGRVVAIKGGKTRIATGQGIVQATGNNLAVGDCVVVENGTTRPISQSTQQVTHKV